MTRWNLNEKTIKVRGEDVKIRQLTAAERSEFFKAIRENGYRGPRLLVSLVMVEPKMSEEEVGKEPEDCITEIAAEAMKLSNIETEDKGKKEQPDGKESSASNT